MTYAGAASYASMDLATVIIRGDCDCILDILLHLGRAVLRSRTACARDTGYRDQNLPIFARWGASCSDGLAAATGDDRATAAHSANVAIAEGIPRDCGLASEAASVGS